VSLLDNTLKVFFADSLKFFLSLYGHRLPALCHDVSSDSRLLASGGADKNIRVWGLDFGDCHKSLFAHDDSVTCLKFVPKTHYLFSCGKDASVKYWDADKFEPLLTLNGHHAAAWCCAMSARGDFLVTGGHDRAIRVWERTDEPFFVDEEKERRLESLLEEGDGGDDDDDDRVAAAARDAAAARGAAAPAGAEAGMAGRKTLETLSAADAIVDALDVARHERERIDAHVKKKARMALEKASMPSDEKKDADEKATRREDEKKLRRLFAGDADSEDEHDVASMKSDSDDDDSDADRHLASGAFGTNESYPKGLPPNPLLMGASPERYALRALENVKAADLERAVLALPFSSAAALLEFLGGWLERGEKTELTCRLAALIVRLHYAQLGATANARGTLLKIRPMLRARAKAFRDVVGFNLAGLGMWAARVEETAGALGGVGKKRAAGDDDDDGGDDDDDELLDDEDAGVSVPGWG
jgi:U3 small nucleolar RNA-associated protein 12